MVGFISGHEDIIQEYMQPELKEFVMRILDMSRLPHRDLYGEEKTKLIHDIIFGAYLTTHIKEKDNRTVLIRKSLERLENALNSVNSIMEVEDIIIAWGIKSKDFHRVLDEFSDKYQSNKLFLYEIIKQINYNTQPKLCN